MQIAPFLTPASATRRLGWHRNPALRRLVFALLSRAGNHDISIAHHWVPSAQVRLNLFRHRGYWYHASRRERGVMTSLPRLIRPGDTVIEAGAHIGYVSLYLADLVGPLGRVYAFEPSSDNLCYLTANVAPFAQIEAVPAALSDKIGIARFYIEALSGQNSTLIGDYGNLARNNRMAGAAEQYRETSVETVTLDQFIASRGISPSFIKIDIEGAELLALGGMKHCLSHVRPKLMIEVTNRKEEVMRLMKEAGYLAFDNHLKRFGPGADQGPNRFFLPEEEALRFLDA
ncbi:FkbM family methyltransferase [Sphingobium bisphenolivorans]|uniref:FkbM family methyltransferase n=1 Tax=Sphingobium bisphenolivorans TaxID=1335760 RepID=UPI00039CD883|nr:FkbM family methyltransferase [Sphingobium bisphenolivorans]